MRALSELDVRFADRVAKVRRFLRMSQQTLADRLGWGRAVVSTVEGKQRPVTLGEAQAIAQVLGVPLADLISDQPMSLAVDVPID